MKVVRLSVLCTATFTPQDIFLVLISIRGSVDDKGHSAAGKIMSMKNSSDTIGNRTLGPVACSAVPQPTAPPRAPLMHGIYNYLPETNRFSRVYIFETIVWHV